MENISTTSSLPFSSWSTCRCEGSSCIKFCGVCVLASSSQSERHHQEIHRFLLQPTPHGNKFKKLSKTFCILTYILTAKVPVFIL